MNSKQFKACMTPHVMLHSLFGLGLGLLLASLLNISGGTGLLLGLLAMVVAVFGDVATAKKK